jgi:tight adherence protein B
MTLVAASAVAAACAAIAWMLWSRFAGPGPEAPGRGRAPVPPTVPVAGPVAVSIATRIAARVDARVVAWLREAGVDRAPGAVAIGIGVGAVAVFLLVATATRSPLVAVAPAGVAVAVPVAALGHRRRRRRRAVLAAWPDALRELVATLAAGRSLGQALVQLGTTGPEPLRAVFGDFPAWARVLGTAGALEAVQARLADPTSDRVREVLLVAHEHGGAIVREILEDLVVATTADIEVLDEIDTEGLEMRINGRAVLVLPWLVLVALTLRPGPFRDFYTSPGGTLVIVAAGVCSAAGAWWLGRLGAEPTEPRVFGGAADDRSGR